MKDGNKYIYQKNADKVLNRVIIPKSFIDKHGRNFIMEVFDDYIKITPEKKYFENKGGE